MIMFNLKDLLLYYYSSLADELFLLFALFYIIIFILNYFQVSQVRDSYTIYVDMLFIRMFNHNPAVNFC